MKYFFILGRTPELSILEICSVARAEGITLSDILTIPSALICTASPELPIEKFMARLGGTIKIGILIQKDAVDLKNPDILPFFEYFLLSNSTQKIDRITFGFSAYTLSQSKKKEKTLSSLLFRLGLSLKKLLKGKDTSCRLVPCSDGKPFLSSVSVQKNHLLPPEGSEFVCLEYGNAFFLGRTHAVQPFEEYSFRDWNRPKRDMNVGLLPPKLAQIMINLSGSSPSKNHILLDPFCGFGTVIQESLLIGFSSVYGSDINPQIVSAAQKNLSWLAKKKNLVLPHDCVRIADATRLSRSFSPSSLDAIITEPYLGPVIRSGSVVSQKTMNELSVLYTAFLREAFRVLKKNGTTVLALPVWLWEHKKIFLPLEDILTSAGFLNAIFQYDCTCSLQKTPRGTLLYSRAGQSVGREIIVLKKAL